MSLSVHIEKQLGNFRLHVQFESSGGLLALLGASGSGKSVTLRCIAGLMTPDRGRIVLNGRVLYDSEAGIDLPPQKRRVGFLFQRCALIPHLTVVQNVELGLHALPRRERRAAALAWLERFRLEGFADALPATLSGGEGQRAALARTLAARPEALLLDEPFSALDDALKWPLELELARSLEDFGGDAVLVTHSRDEVCRLARTVCVLDRGRSEPLCSTAALMTSPGTLAAALLSGCKNVSPVALLPDGRLRCTEWDWTLPACPVPEGLTHLGVRAHSLCPGPGAISLDCSVERVIDNVFSDIYMLKTPGPGLLRMELPKAFPLRGRCPSAHTGADEVVFEDAVQFSPGAALTVHVSPGELLLLTEA